MTRRVLLGRACLSVLFAAQAALAIAQPAYPPADPIGALLDRPVRSEDEPDVAGQPSSRPTPDPEDGLPSAPVPYSATTPVPYAAPPYATPPYATGAPARPALTAPVHLEETGKSPDGPPSVRDLAYESRLRASFASAQSFQGALDGSWTLSDARGAELYAFQLADRGRGVVEGAWRDLRRPGEADASGFVDEIQRSSAGLVLRFSPHAGTPVATATLQGGYGGRWTGDLIEDGKSRAVALVKKPR